MCGRDTKDTKGWGVGVGCLQSSSQHERGEFGKRREKVIWIEVVVVVLGGGGGLEGLYHYLW